VRARTGLSNLIACDMPDRIAGMVQVAGVALLEIQWSLLTFGFQEG